MVKLLSDNYNFKIITRDRDQLQDHPYENIKVNKWNDGAKSKIFYKTKNKELRTVINETEFDQYYLNSLFAYSFSIRIIFWRALGIIPKKPILLAPRGELIEGALSFKKFKKSSFLFLVKLFRVYKNITWHASNEMEANSIENAFGKSAKVKIAMDIPNFNKTYYETNHKKEKSNLKILFISSIVRNKNLKLVIEVLNKVKGDFTLDIYGPIKDQKYWEECENIIEPRLKNNIKYKGIVPYSEIHAIYPNYDLFFFPTMGESFGHVIFESLLYNCPVLCSDKTPFNNLNTFNAGWNLTLQNKEEYLNIIKSLIPLDNDEFKKYRTGCNSFVNYLKNNKDNVNNNLDLFKLN